jgi:hypothetical protein
LTAILGSSKCPGTFYLTPYTLENFIDGPDEGALFLVNQGIEVAAGALVNFLGKGSLYPPFAIGAGNGPAGPATIDSAVNAVGAKTVGCRTLAQLSHLATARLPTALLHLPAISFHSDCSFVVHGNY